MKTPAPCRLAAPPADGERIQCECPTYRGVYQVGQSGQKCSIPGAYVWSAANAVQPPASGNGG